MKWRFPSLRALFPSDAPAQTAEQRDEVSGFSFSFLVPYFHLSSAGFLFETPGKPGMEVGSGLKHSTAADLVSPFSLSS